VAPLETMTPMFRHTPLAAALLATLAAGGCAGFGASQPMPLPAVPAQPVAAAPLPPPPAALPPPVEEPPPPITPVALPAADAQLPIQRNELVGGWVIESGGERCQLFINLTGWTGGYRASTRGCTSEELKGVSAWDLAGKEITLKDSATAPIATLVSVETGRFTGRLKTGAGVTVYR
jgi:hypothetical protein